MSQADPARALRQRGKQELGLGGMRIAAHEVVLDQPRAAITEAVGQLDFGKRVGIGLRFAADRLRWQRDFVEQIELHKEPPTSCQRGQETPIAQLPILITVATSLKSSLFAGPIRSWQPITSSKSKTSTTAYDKRRAILIGIDMVIPRGKVVAIMGISGSGKTTLLRLIGGVMKADARARSGSTASWCTSSIPQGIYKMRRRMGMLFQFGALFTDLSVFDNVAFQMREHTDLPETHDPRSGDDEAACGGPARRAQADARRTVRRHGAAGGAGARDRARPDADDVRRAVYRPRPDFAGRDPRI